MSIRDKAARDKHYREYQGTPEQIKKRAQRNAAHAKMEKIHGKAALKGKDVDHKRMLKDGGSNSTSNLRITSPHQNRGWERKGK